MVNNKTFEHRPISQLIAIVRNDLRKFSDEGLIDDGNLIKTVMYCNDKLGIPIREIKQMALDIVDYKAKLPLDFEKLYYICGLNATNTLVHNLVNPWDNNFDQDVIYEASLDRESLGACKDNYRVVIKRESETTIHTYNNWIPLSIDSSNRDICQIDCPNLNNRGRYTVSINGDTLDTPFRAGTVYIMYVGSMINEEGEILFPFHPMITPYYEWMLKEKVIQDAIFNSDGVNLGELYKVAQQERLKAWIDASNITLERDFSDYVTHQRNKELSWYNKWFKYFQ